MALPWNLVNTDIIVPEQNRVHSEVLAPLYSIDLRSASEAVLQQSLDTLTRTESRWHAFLNQNWRDNGVIAAGARSTLEPYFINKRNDIQKEINRRVLEFRTVDSLPSASNIDTEEHSSAMYSAGSASPQAKAPSSTDDTLPPWMQTTAGNVKTAVSSVTPNQWLYIGAGLVLFMMLRRKA